MNLCYLKIQNLYHKKTLKYLLNNIRDLCNHLENVKFQCKFPIQKTKNKIKMIMKKGNLIWLIKVLINFEITYNI